MVKLVSKIGLLTGSILLTLGLLYWLTNQYSSTGYFAAIIDKHHRADALKDCPRLLLVGGSGTAFGVDSQLLEDSLHLPVVNLAIHADLGLPFILRQVQSVARPGDVVLLIPEYLLGRGDDYTQFYASQFYAPAKMFMTFDGPYDYAVRRAIYYLKRIQNGLLVGADDQRMAKISDTTFVYFRAGFSHQGDLISPHNNRRSDNIGRIQLVFRGYAEEVNLINAAAANMHGVTTLITYPAFAKSQFLANTIAISQYVRELTKLRMVQLIGIPERVVYPDSCFFDSPYHLYSVHRQDYSGQLLRHLNGLKRKPAKIQLTAVTQ